MLTTLFLAAPASLADDGLEPGDAFRDPMPNGGEGPLLVVVPGGTFEFGRRVEWEPRLAARPTATVTIPGPFAVGVFETTYFEWDACVAKGGCSHWPHPVPKRGNHPVSFVSWHDAQQYVEWLSQQTGQAYRLPSESEWEYVALAGGNPPKPKVALLDPLDPWPVGSSLANALGVHGLYGNLREWVQDCATAGHVAPPPDGRPWLGGDCTSRVMRGGAFDHGGWRQHSTIRNHHASSYRKFNTGFRVVRTLGERR